MPELQFQSYFADTLNIVYSQYNAIPCLRDFGGFLTVVRAKIRIIRYYKSCAMMIFS